MASDTGDELSSAGKDSEGSVETRKVQRSGRVNLPNSYLRHIGVGESENVLVVNKGDSIEIRPANVDEIPEAGVRGEKDGQ